jgi:hypothetical protein
MKKIKHNDLTHYFLRDHKDLPPAYLKSCQEFFESLKPQASSNKQVTSKPECDIIKTESENI